MKGLIHHQPLFSSSAISALYSRQGCDPRSGEVCIEKRGWWFRECYFKLLAVPAWQMSFIIGEPFYYLLNLLWINFRSYSPFFFLIISLWKLKLVVKSELNLKSKCFREAFGNAKSCVLRFLVNLNQKYFYYTILLLILKAASVFLW